MVRLNDKLTYNLQNLYLCAYYMGKQKFYDTAIKQERAVLVGVITPGEKEEQTKEYLDELAF